MANETRIKIRRGTAAEWTSNNPTLGTAEMGFETDTGRAKFGDASTAWTSLAYYFPGIVDNSTGVIITITDSAVSFADKNITNVGDIALDSISSAAGTSINVVLGSDSGDDFTVDTNKLVVEGDTGNIGVAMTPVKKLDVTGEIRASTGILFGADTAAANTLDDYEEGTWTPTVGGDATFDANNRGEYTKIGNVVTVRARLDINVIGTGSNTTVSGAPFAAGAINFQQVGSAPFFSGLALSAYSLGVYINASASTIEFAIQAVLDAASDNGAAILASSTRIHFAIQYQV